VKVYCGNIKCENCSTKNICKAKEIDLELHGVNTTYQGFQDFLKCKSFKESKEYIEIKEMLKKVFKENK
jgi:hypothetical protein